MTKTLEYLLQREWSMGNGQCPDCCGVPEGWLGHPCHRRPESLGHQSDCPLALALHAEGYNPLFQGGSQMPPGEYDQFCGGERRLIPIRIGD